MSDPKALADDLRRITVGTTVISITGRAADTIDALVKERDQFRNAWNAQGFEIIRLEDERDALVAVVEKVRDAIGRAEIAFDIGVPWSQAVDDSHEAALSALSTAPADALREHDARLIERLAESYVYVHAATRTHSRVYQWLRKRARLIREGDKK